MTQFRPKPFGKYFLIDKLATGGMAEIYKAKTFGVDGFEKLLAIKRILPHCASDKDFIKMLIDEAKLSVLLSHTNIVQVYDLGKVGEDYFISMEYISGINLREVLNRLKDTGSPLAEELVCYIISEICKGLDYAHSKKDSDGKPLNIVHRDISPQNILISFEGEVKIVDFGIAKAAMNISHTMAGILKGKISYMSPEQALGKPIDRKTDIFSTGLMLYELLTGEKFFTGETQFEVLKKIRTTRVTEASFGDRFPETLRKILAKSLAYSVKDRYDNAGDFQIDLTRYLYTTFPDFTPRKLKNIMAQIFANEIESKREREKRIEEEIEPQTRSIMIDPLSQENIVHRERTSEQSAGGSEKQATQTFIESFISGQEGPDANPEPSITRTQQKMAPEFEAERTPAPVRGAPQVSPPAVPSAQKSGGLGKIIGIASVALLLAVGTWTYFKTDLFKKTPPEVTKPVAQGVVQVQSNPEGAQIFVNGNNTQKVTPAKIEQLEIGPALTITLKKPKHKEWSKTVTLTDPNPISLNPTLEVIPVGSIKVSSTPPGAKILLDGEDTGKITPATLEDVPLSRTYSLKLELDKYRPAEERVTIYSIEPMEFQKKLEEIQYGNLQVTSNPSGAAVYLNNSNTGKTTPATLSNLEVGKSYTVRLSRSGYQEVTRSVNIASTGTSSVKATLTEKEKAEEKTTETNDKIKEAADKLRQMEAQKEAEALKRQKAEQDKKREAEIAKEKEAKSNADKNVKNTPKDTTSEETPQSTVAYVSVSSDPKGADVFINGVRKGSAPGKFDVASGRPTEISISKSGLSTVTRVITLRPGETRNLGTINLKGSEAAGIVVIDSNPPGAMVLLNGQPQSRTPLRVKGLRPGVSYQFTVQKEGYESWTRSVTIGEDAKSFMANLKKN